MSIFICKDSNSCCDCKKKEYIISLALRDDVVSEAFINENSVMNNDRFIRGFCLFMSNYGKHIDKNEIVEHVWKGNSVSNSSLGVYIHNIRLVFLNENIEFISVRNGGYYAKRKNTSAKRVEHHTKSNSKS
ncbi:helix-turn-helix domain-containing protein [Aeromonas hydrophila]|uniref:helix-turn-helix domain-containing protein n=1 Tax=Aeromonas hydrophila TaxID=644 RepID=UPI001CDCC72A|nr:helix-turn-helix domain-containing protein [Aeromonas hydrophila]MCA4698422.1 helix-turn-helix domain-containing protein [Aeromonas hydrophila]